MTRACWMRNSLWFCGLDLVHKHHISMQNVVVIVERSWRLDKRWPNTSSTSTTVIENRYIDSLRFFLSVDHFQFSRDHRVDPNLKLRQGPKTLHTWFKLANTLTQLSTRGVAISNFDSLGSTWVRPSSIFQAHASDPDAARLSFLKPKLFKRPTLCPPSTELQNRAEGRYLMKGSSGGQLPAVDYATPPRIIVCLPTTVSYAHQFIDRGPYC